jgi:Uma2 family endonuclease
MIKAPEQISVVDFEQWALLPENAQRHYELIEGEIREKMVANSQSSNVAMVLGSFITVHVLQYKLGRVTGADGGYRVGDGRYIPDVAFISAKRQAQDPKAAYNPLAPDLAVEVLSPSDDPDETRYKLSQYLAANVVVWFVNPEKRYVEVHTPAKMPRRLGVSDILEGDAVLEGFRLALNVLFPEETPAPDSPPADSAASE